MDSISFFSTIGLKNILLISAGTVNLVFSVIVYLTDRKKQKNVFFSLFGASVSLWAFSMVVFNVSTNSTIFFIAANWLYISAAGIPFFFYFLSESMDEGESPVFFANKGYVISVFFLIIFLLNIPDFILVIPENPMMKELSFGIYGYPLYACYIISFFLISLISLFEKFKSMKNALIKKQILFLTSGTFAAVLIGINTNLIFPFLGEWRFFWFGPVSTIIMVIFVGYSVIRHRLFNTKSITVEAVTFVLWVVMLMRLFLSVGLIDFILNGILLLMIVFGGLILINTIYKEIMHRERMENLAKKLEETNEHLRLLDQQKSEFVSIASHQLRTPLTAIKGYSSMLLEGDYGKLSQKTRDAVDRIFQSSVHLVGIVEDFLNISRIEQGRMTYQFTSVDMKEMVENIIDESKTRAIDKKQKLEIVIDKNESFNVTADAGKILQVLSNLVDNAIKYTQDGGEIKVRLVRDVARRRVIFSVKDNGLGMTPQTLTLLFQKFSRADGVRKIYTEGLGLGLYVASEMMKAHHGRIWAESEGAGKGSTFFVELLAED